MRDRLLRLIFLFWAYAACGNILSAAEFKFGEETLTVPDGFTVELAAESPLVDRPITFDKDEQGRLYVADSSGSNDPVEKQLAEKPHRILRLEDTDGDGRYDRRTVFADKLMLPQGTMWLAGSLYVSAAPSIWKLTDTNDDGTADRREEWFAAKTLTGCANDLHGPYRGRDGWIYWCKGAFAEQTYDLPAQAGWKSRAAHIFRARVDGTGIEPVLTGGMDNPVDVVFTPAGERILSCTFLQNPSGGNRDGLIHAIYGGVYGKDHDVLVGHRRTGELMPVLRHLGPAAPCGLHYYESDSLGTDCQGHVFACQFNLRKVTCHKLVPSGASFTTDDSDFLTSDSADFHPTDIIEDADGSLLVCDTGGWYKLCCPTSQFHKPEVLGAIYRIRRVEATEPKAHDSAAARLGQVWSRSRIDSPRARELNRKALTDADPTVRQAAAHLAGLWRDAAALELLCDCLKHESPAVARATAEALGRLGSTKAIAPLLATSRRAEDRVLEHSIVYALIEIGDPAGVWPSLAAVNPRERRVAMIALSQMPTSELQASDIVPLMTAEESIVRDAAWWVARGRPDWGEDIFHHWTKKLASAPAKAEDLDRLVEPLAELARGDAIQKYLANMVLSPDQFIGAKTTSLRAMQLSRVTPIPDAWIDALVASLDHTDLRGQSLATMRSLGLAAEHRQRVRSAILELVEHKSLPLEQKLAALELLGDQVGAIEGPLFTSISRAMTTATPLERTTAASILANAKLRAEDRAVLVAAIDELGPMEITRLLPVFVQTPDDERRQVITNLTARESLAGIRRDVLNDFVASLPDSMKAEGASLLSKADAALAERSAKLDSLAGTLGEGDVARGKALFQHKKTACVACHAMGYVGGQTGPDLSRIGQIRTERDLLEAILYPSASFVRSYEPITVTTSAGQVWGGILKQETSEEIVLTTGPQTNQRIARDEVEDMQPSQTSLMPDGLDKALSKQELADLIAYLKAAK